MQIVRVDERYFVGSSARDLQDIALKIMNEHRTMKDLPDDLAAFNEQVCDEMDGATAWMLVRKIHSAEVITPEII